MSDSLPEEIFVEILSRLPVKSLLQFRCVCKLWNSLITSSNFITKHLTHSTTSNKNKNSGLILLRYWPKETKKLHYSLRYDNETLSQYMELESLCFESQISDGYLRVIGSCNGLICLSDNVCRDGYTFIFWNPLIRKSLTLPKPRITYLYRGFSYRILGFGYDSRADDYKLVKIVYRAGLDGGSKALPKVELYSLSTGTWKFINAAAPNYIVSRWYNNAFANGAAHWIAYRMTDGDLCSIVLAFDMCDEVFSKMKLPKSLVGWYMSIFEFGESISVIDCSNIGRGRCDFWVMKEYNVVESWTKQYTLVLLYTINGDVCHNILFQKVLGFRKDGEVLLELYNGELALYNPESNRVHDTGIRGERSCYSTKSYVESLVLLDKPD